jgi:hypothetical protein
MTQNSPDQTQPTSKFTNLALLLRLLVLLNSKTGSVSLNSTLSVPTGQDAEKRDQGLSALEGAAAILVQNHEIIATAAMPGKAGLVASQSVRRPGQPDSEGASNGTDLDIPAIQVESSPTLAEMAGSRKPSSMKFTAVPNPDMKTNARRDGGQDNPESTPQNPHNLRVLSPGSSLFNVIKAYEWAYVLM